MLSTGGRDNWTAGDHQKVPLMSVDHPTELDAREQVIRIDQMIVDMQRTMADRDRKRQEIQLALWPGLRCPADRSRRVLRRRHRLRFAVWLITAATNPTRRAGRAPRRRPQPHR